MLEGCELRIHDYSDPVPSLEFFSVIQPRAINEPLFPNMKALDLWRVEERSIPFVPLFLSPRTTSIKLRFGSNLSEEMVTSTVRALPTLRPNLQAIKLYYCPGGPVITAAISGMLHVFSQRGGRWSPTHASNFLAEGVGRSYYPPLWLTWISVACAPTGSLLFIVQSILPEGVVP